MVSHTTAMFDGHKHDSSGVIMNLACNIILQDYVIKELDNIMSRNSSR